MLVQNRRASFEFFIQSTYEAGLSLEGWEVKSILASKVSLDEAYVKILGDEIFLIGCHITPTSKYSQFSNLDPTRVRKLLLKRQEINKLIGKVQISGFTLVPLSLIYKHRKIKINFALAKGKKLYDKRESIKTRQSELEVQRAIKIRA